MTIPEVTQIIQTVTYRDWWFTFDESTREVAGRFLTLDTLDGKSVIHTTRKWRLSQHMTKSEIVQTMLKLVLSAEEHEVREHFLYKDHPVFGPHYDVDALLSVCDTLDVRQEVARAGA